MKSQEALVEELRDALIKKKTGIYGFGLVYEGGQTYMRSNAPCYAYVFYPGKEHQNLDIDYMIVNPGLYNNPIQVDLHKAWLSWILHKSPWAPYYLTKDVEEVYHRGVVISTDELSFPMMMQAATLIRVPMEHSCTVEIWDIARRLIPPEYALMLGHVTHGKSYITDSPSYKGHSFVSSASREQLHGWVHRLPSPWKDCPAAEGRLFSGMSWRTAWIESRAYGDVKVNLELAQAPKKSHTFSKQVTDRWYFPSTDKQIKLFCEDFVIQNTVEDECVKKAA